MFSTSKILLRLQTIHRGSDTQRAALPFQVGEAFVYQEADIVTVESEMGFNLQCNMKFDICLFEVAGKFNTSARGSLNEFCISRRMVFWQDGRALGYYEQRTVR